MFTGSDTVDIKEAAFQKLEHENALS
jgi:hypothetical protein